MRQNTTIDRPAKKPSTVRPGEQGRRDDDREAVGSGDDDLTDDLDELEDEEDIEDESEDDEA